MSFATVQDGHKALAYTFKNSANLWCARGILPDDYPGKWGISDTPPDSLTSVSTDTLTKGAEGSLDETLHNPVRKIYKVTDVSGEVVYDETSYTMDTTGIKWRVGESQPATNSQYKASYLYTNNNIKSLVQELDFIKVNSMYFVKQDLAGTVEAGGVKWSLSEETTPFVYCMWKFPANAHLNNTIYQLGIYTGTQVKGNEDETGLKTLDQLQTKGDLFMVDNIRPFTTSENVRLYVELIISF